MIVQVKYCSETTGELSARSYSYFTEEALKVGDVVKVPVKDTVGKAKVVAIDVPEVVIQAFRDKVKTIPAGSIIPPVPDKKATEAEKLVNQFGLDKPEAKEAADALKALVNPGPYEAQVEAEYIPPCPVAGCTAVVRPGILREFVVCPVHGEQWVGEEDEP